MAENKAAHLDSKLAEPRQRKPDISTQKHSGVVSFLVTFLIMAFFWILFSGKFDFFHITLGIVSCLIIAAASKDLLFPTGIGPGLIICWLRFAGYVPWLLYQIFLSNLHVLYITFHPDMMELIDPKIVEFKSRLTSDIARTTFGNSITLTPGTITVHVSALGDFAVHCIDEKSSHALPGDMEAKIAKVFNE